jgi:hypothetical protein
MVNILPIFLVTCGIIFCGITVSLILKHKLSERSSVIWLGGSLIILLMAGQPKILDKTASILGIAYPPSLLFLLSTLILLLSNLYQSIQIAKLNGKIKDITQFIALNETKEQYQAGRKNGE